MATVYGPPEGFDPPEFDDAFVNGRYDMNLDDKLHSEYIAKLAAEAQRHHSGDLVGEIIRFPIADGYAQYMVWNHRPLELIHLPIHDNILKVTATRRTEHHYEPWNPHD